MKKLQFGIISLTLLIVGNTYAEITQVQLSRLMGIELYREDNPLEASRMISLTMTDGGVIDGRYWAGCAEGDGFNLVAGAWELDSNRRLAITLITECAGGYVILRQVIRLDFTSIEELSTYFNYGLYDRPKRIPSEYTDLSAAQLNEQGLSYHRNREYGRAREFFYYAALKEPSTARGLFNVACTYSLEGETNFGTAALAQAALIDPQWVAKYISDTDIDNLRGADGFDRVTKILSASR